MSDSKPRIRVQAGTTAFSTDSFQNLAAGLGLGAANTMSGSGYGFNPLSRNRNQIEWMYRGSWIVRQLVDAPADDMCRQGININSDLPPDVLDRFGTQILDLRLWDSLNEALKWSRLYGGALAVIMVDGQDTAEPLRLETVRQDSFRGLMSLDRWQVEPTQEITISDIGPDYGMPMYYRSFSGVSDLPPMKIHHTRAVRFEGIRLPFWQRQGEQGWGISVVEPLYDRLVAFDSGTTGAAQLLYRSHIRTYAVPGLRELIAMGGTAYTAFLNQIRIMRLMQSNEGLTVIDKEDVFETHDYGFGGVSDILIQLAQQLSGACQIPLTRLFGQSPAGMDATGESDMRNYYDSIKAAQETKLRRPLTRILDVAYRSLFGQPLPDGFGYSFNPLWQLSEVEKSNVANTTTGAVLGAFEQGVVSAQTVLKELRQQSDLTGVWSNITDEDIAAADAQPPQPGADMGDEGMEGMAPGQPGAQPPEHPGGAPPPAKGIARPALHSSVPPPGADGGQAGDDAAAAADPERYVREALDFDRHLPRSPVAARKYVAKKHGFGPLDRKSAKSLVSKMFADGLSVRMVGDLPVVIETAAGGRRQGAGWEARMPDGVGYGYISGTSSAGGPDEQMDAFVGPDPDATEAYVLEQVLASNKRFDEHKILLGFPDRDSALKAYYASHSDGLGPVRAGRVHTMAIPELRAFLGRWRYGMKNPGDPSETADRDPDDESDQGMSIVVVNGERFIVNRFGAGETQVVPVDGPAIPTPLNGKMRA